MKFCGQCGGENQQKIPEGDNRERAVCTQCGLVQYENPKIVCGCLPIFKNKVLLCKRAIEPRRGYWTLPAGFMENGETLEQGAMRETWEEACAEVENLHLYNILNLPRINQVYVMFKSDLVKGEHSAGVESLETALFEEQDIPWEQLAFPTVTHTLKHYFEDRKGNHFPLHLEDIIYKRKQE